MLCYKIRMIVNAQVSKIIECKHLLLIFLQDENIQRKNLKKESLYS